MYDIIDNEYESVTSFSDSLIHFAADSILGSKGTKSASNKEMTTYAVNVTGLETPPVIRKVCFYIMYELYYEKTYFIFCFSVISKDDNKIELNDVKKQHKLPKISYLN